MKYAEIWTDRNGYLNVVSEDGTVLHGGFTMWADAVAWANENGYRNDDWNENE